MDPAEVVGDTGAPGIAEDALVTVTYSTASGIRLPKEALTPFQFGEFHAHEIIVRTTNVDGFDTGVEDDGDKTEFQLPRVLNLSLDEGSKGDTVRRPGRVSVISARSQCSWTKMVMVVSKLRATDSLLRQGLVRTAPSLPSSQ